MRWRKRAELTETRHSPLTIAALISQITSCVLDIISGSAQSRFILRKALTLVKMLTFVRAPPVTPLSTPTNKKKTYRGWWHHAAWIHFKRNFVQRVCGTYQGLKKISEKIGAEGKFQAKQIQFLSKFPPNCHCDNSAFSPLLFMMCLCEL